MFKYLLLGMVGAGKSTLFNMLRGVTDAAGKTQAVDYDLSGGVDTPGEFFCFHQFYPALLSLTSEADTIVYVHAADDTECHMPPGLLEVYRDRQLIVVITKADLPGVDVKATEAMLRANGLGDRQFFIVRRDDESSYQRLRDWLDANAGTDS